MTTQQQKDRAILEHFYDLPREGNSRREDNTVVDNTAMTFSRILVEELLAAQKRLLMEKAIEALRKLLDENFPFSENHNIEADLEDFRLLLLILLNHV